MISIRTAAGPPIEAKELTDDTGSLDKQQYMKFPTYEKETKDEKYASDPYRAVNFRTDESGNLICPNDRKLTFS